MTALFRLVHRSPALPASHQPIEKERIIYAFDEYEFFSDNSIRDLEANKVKIMAALGVPFDLAHDTLSVNILNRIPMVNIHG